MLLYCGWWNFCEKSLLVQLKSCFILSTNHSPHPWPLFHMTGLKTCTLTLMNSRRISITVWRGDNFVISMTKPSVTQITRPVWRRVGVVSVCLCPATPSPPTSAYSGETARRDLGLVQWINYNRSRIWGNRLLCVCASVCVCMWVRARVCVCVCYGTDSATEPFLHHGWFRHVVCVASLRL